MIRSWDLGTKTASMNLLENFPGTFRIYSFVILREVEGETLENTQTPHQF